MTALCGNAAASLSCALYTDIYGRAVTRPFAVHSMATGINTTSASGTRDWLMQNIIKATDEYSFNLSTNMTSLVRQNFGIDDRVRKAWFINPGNRWNVPMTTGYQSDLLLSDRLIAVAVITLNDGSGNILRRRLMSFTSGGGGGGGGSGSTLLRSSMLPTHNAGKSRRGLLQSSSSESDEFVRVPLQPEQLDVDETTFREAARETLQEPKTGTLPPFQYNVDIPKTMTEVYGVGNGEKSFNVLDFVLYARFDDTISEQDAMEKVGAEFMRRLQVNIRDICPTCERIMPVFNNLQKYNGPVVRAGGEGLPTQNRRRNLLQSSSQVPGIVYGTHSVIFVYNGNATQPPLQISNIQRAVYNANVTMTWNASASDLAQFLSDLKNNQFILGDLKVMQTTSPSVARCVWVTVWLMLVTSSIWHFLLYTDVS